MEFHIVDRQRAKSLNSEQSWCEKLDSTTTGVYNSDMKEG